MPKTNSLADALLEKPIFMRILAEESIVKVMQSAGIAVPSADDLIGTIEDRVKNLVAECSQEGGVLQLERIHQLPPDPKMFWKINYTFIASNFEQKSATVLFAPRELSDSAVFIQELQDAVNKFDITEVQHFETSTSDLQADRLSEHFERPLKIPAVNKLLNLVDDLGKDAMFTTFVSSFNSITALVSNSKKTRESLPDIDLPSLEKN